MSRSSPWPTSWRGSPGRCCSAGNRLTPKRYPWPRRGSLGRSESAGRASGVCGRVKTRWPDSQTALRKPGVENGARRRRVYEDRGARISIWAGRSPPRPDTLKRTDQPPISTKPLADGAGHRFSTQSVDSSRPLRAKSGHSSGSGERVRATFRRHCRQRSRQWSDFAAATLRRQRQRLELLPSRAKAAELIDRSARWRERKRRERLRQHFIQIFFGCNADRHMRIEALARRVSHEILDIADEEYLDVAPALVAVASCRGPGLHSVGLDRFDERILQPMQVFRWFDDDPSEADRRRGDIVIFERLKRPRLGFLFVKDGLRRGIYPVEIIRADKLL